MWAWRDHSSSWHLHLQKWHVSRNVHVVGAQGLSGMKHENICPQCCDCFLCYSNCFSKCYLPQQVLITSASANYLCFELMAISSLFLCFFLFFYLVTQRSVVHLSFLVLVFPSLYPNSKPLLSCFVWVIQCFIYPLFIFSVSWADSPWYWPAKADYGRGWSRLESKNKSPWSPEGGVNRKLWELSPSS